MAFKKDHDEVMAKVTNFAKSVQSKDTTQAIQDLAVLAGVDPLELSKQMREQVIEIAQKYSNLSEDQKKVLDLEEENAYHKAQDARRIEQEAANHSQQENEVAISNFQQASNLDDKELVALYDRFVAQSPEEADISVAALEAFHKTEVIQPGDGR